jgi:hypothetical protein
LGDEPAATPPEVPAELVELTEVVACGVTPGGFDWTAHAMKSKAVVAELVAATTAVRINELTTRRSKGSQRS